MNFQDFSRLWRCGLVLLLIGCQRAAPNADNSAEQADAAINQPTILMVTSEPLLQLARQIVGGAASAGDSTVDGQPSPGNLQIERAIEDGTVSVDWSPSGDQVRRIQSARILLINGAGFEPWRDRVTLGRSKIVDTAAGYYDQFLRIPDAVVHQHGPDGAHSHPGTVWATWLDPELLTSQMRQVQDTLTTLLPDQAKAFASRAAEIQQELNQLEQQVNRLAAKTAKMKLTILSDGPYYLYLGRRLGLEIQYLHWPVATDALYEDNENAFRSAVDQTDFNLFLMLDSRGPDAQKLLESAGLPVVSIDLCHSNRDDSASLIDRLKGNLDRLSAAIEAMQ